MIVRPCFLILDPEHANSISSRKLVLETAKYNVITAYSCSEAVATLERFPAVDAVILNSLIALETGYENLADAFVRHPQVKVILVGDSVRGAVEHRIDAQVEGFAPAGLLATIQGLFPAASQQLQKRESSLEKQ